MAALLNQLVRYKMNKISRSRFLKQLLLWLCILLVLICSFPVYNMLINRPIFDSIDLSAFDIVQTTAIVFLFYVINNQRQKNEQLERRVRDLHQELSIKLAAIENGK